MEPRFLLDTNTVIYIRKRAPKEVLDAFRRLQPGETAISVITYGELIYGISKSPNSEAAREVLGSIITLIPVLPLPQGASEEYGRTRRELEARGQPIGNNDLWIAAHALAAGMTLVTNNEKEFRRVPRLKIQNWTK